ncbi:hypothetical protein NliqN6_1747 [Naganishia liquefaciens]|uniref:EamA domain-containing protein n=1 Tax=Naganishia liquefaciens TaxID=104408 RepID=A0A8H3YDE3_9TREE|nr:hypothetical protein NliqN6_1747 [Naganishia liquefaciens]
MKGLSRNKQLVSLGVLTLIVCASATQTELANYLTAEKGYSKPYFTFYLTHSVFIIIFPAHLGLLRLLRPNVSTKVWLRNIRTVTAEQLSLRVDQGKEVHYRLAKTIVWLTALLSLPAICWYAAVPLTGTTDLTTLYATATFWTYGFSLLLLKTRLSHLTLIAILVAFLGVAVITYSGAHENETTSDDRDHPTTAGPKEPPHRMLGDLIMLIGAICLGFYEVIYKMSLPEGHGGVSSPADVEVQDLHGSGYEAVEVEDEDDTAANRSRPARPLGATRRSSSLLLVRKDPNHPGSSSLPLALHANFLTSLIGAATLLLFWIPIPFLHLTGLEEFELPHGNFALLATICTMGATYNAGFMCLIGLLGPVTASVANLLAIGLVALIDAVYLARAIPFWTLCGASLVAGGFAVLLYQGEGEVDHDSIEDEQHAKNDDVPER